MNRLIIFLSEEIEENVFKISSQGRLAHMANILKIQKGDTIRSVVLDKGICQAKVLSQNSQETIVSAIPPFRAPILPEIHLLIALSRPPTVQKILEHGTSMGATSMAFFTAEKSEKSYGNSKVLQEDNIQYRLLAGISQSTYLFKMPTVTILQSPVLEFLNNKRFEASFLLSPKGEFFSPASLIPNKLLIAIGPERGWTQREEEDFKGIGLIPKKISHHTLRVEIATFAALSQIELLNHR